MFSPRTSLVALATITALTAAAGSAVAVAGAADAPAVPATPPVGSALANTIDPAPDPVAAVEPAAAKAFPILRTKPATPMPAALAAQIASPVWYGRNPKLARQIDTVTGQGWVIPGRNYVCVAVPDPIDGWGTSCQTTASAAATGLWVEVGGAPDSPTARTVLTMIPPAGARAAVTAAGSAKAVPVPTVDGVSSGVVGADDSVGLGTL